ncbi:MAG: response regulator [Marinibacterium sp.]
MTEPTGQDLAREVAANLPFLRRHARALTGAQESGDRYALAALEAILADPAIYDRSLAPKTALFQVFHGIWATSGATLEDPGPGAGPQGNKTLAALTDGTREALLLHTIEEFSFDDLAAILSVSPDEARALVDIAYSEMAKSAAGRVMIIEDEAIIAADLEAIVGEMGHQIIGVAPTEAAAVAMAAEVRPDLILSDIQLADQSSGIDAVARINAAQGPIPVIFITAYPERLLTGEGKEPAFLISKPYRVDQVRSAVSQAMFFASAESQDA